MKENQQFDLGITKIIHCYLCNLAYDKTNLADIKFHNKIHERKTKELKESINGNKE